MYWVCSPPTRVLCNVHVCFNITPIWRIERLPSKTASMILEKKFSIYAHLFCTDTFVTHIMWFDASISFTQSTRCNHTPYVCLYNDKSSSNIACIVIGYFLGTRKGRAKKDEARNARVVYFFIFALCLSLFVASSRATKRRHSLRHSVVMSLQIFPHIHLVAFIYHFSPHIHFAPLPWLCVCVSLYVLSSSNMMYYVICVYAFRHDYVAGTMIEIE